MVDEYDRNKDSPISVAIRYNSVESVNLLIKGGAVTEGN